MGFDPVEGPGITSHAGPFDPLKAQEGRGGWGSAADVAAEVAKIERRT
jgi:hypothetical protein